MSDSQNQTQHNEQEPPGKFITLKEGEESARKWIAMNDELFSRLADGVIRGHSKPLKRLADGDSGRNPTES